MNTKINLKQIRVEEIRRRAKDNKAEIGKFYIKQTLDTLDKIRNIFYLITFTFIGYFGAIKYQFNKISIILLSLSIVSGFASYLLLYFFSIEKANLYSSLEKNLSKAFPVLNQYNQMLEKEKEIQENNKRANKYYFWQFISVIFQGVFLLSFIFTVFSLNLKQ